MRDDMTVVDLMDEALAAGQDIVDAFRAWVASRSSDA